MHVVEVGEEFGPESPPVSDEKAADAIRLFEQAGRRESTAFAFNLAVYVLKDRIFGRAERLSWEDRDKMLAAVARAYLGICADYPGYDRSRLVGGVDALNGMILYAAEDGRGRAFRKAALPEIRKRAQILQNDFYSEALIVELAQESAEREVDLERLAAFRDALRG